MIDLIDYNVTSEKERREREKTLKFNVTHVVKPVLFERLFFKCMTFGENCRKTVTYILSLARRTDTTEHVDSSIARLSLRILTFGW